MNGTYVVIVAGGSGSRMGTAIPKQFLDLCGKPILYHTLHAFHDALPDARIVLVLPNEHLSYAQMALQHFGGRADITFVRGGNRRYDSVQNGLKGIPEDSIILVHDGVRPLVSRELILRCVDAARNHGSAIPVLAATDSMRFLDEHAASSKPLDRERVRIVQTPQVFRGNILLAAFREPYNIMFTDEATVVEAMGVTVHFVAGEKRNLKITTPEDIVVATALMSQNNVPAV